MPRRVESFGPQLLLEGVVRRLTGIQQAMGYNTQPRVTTDRRQLRQKGPQFALLVRMGDLENPTSTGAPRFRPRQTVEVIGVALPGQQDPQTALNALKQDVLTVLTSDLSAFATELGGGVLSLGALTTEEEGEVTDDGLIGFHLPITYEWSQQPPW